MKTINNIKILLPLSVLMLVETHSLRAQYTVDFSNSSTYTTTCGSVNAAQWEVRNDSCTLYTPVLYPSIGNSDSTMVKFSVRINQSGNLDNSDKVYIYVQIGSGSYELKKIYSGARHANVFAYDDSEKVSIADNFKFIIVMHNNSKSNFWQIKTGGISVANVTTASHLPIELLSFNAIPINNSVLLKWVTASETNNDYFTIERSANGMDFSPAGTIAGAGNSNSLKEYSFNDESPVAATYYRLKQTDFNGAFTYSNIILVNASGSKTAAVGINAANGILHVTVNNALAGPLMVNVYSNAAALVYSNASQIGSGSSTIDLTPSLPTGIYTVRVNMNNMRPVTSKVFMN